MRFQSLSLRVSSVNMAMKDPLFVPGNLIMRRLRMSNAVAQHKWLNAAPVADKLREAEVRSRAEMRATNIGLPNAPVIQVMNAQMSASRLVQRALLNTWADQPWRAPIAAPDLDYLRRRLDALDAEMVDSLEVTLALSDSAFPVFLDFEHRRLSSDATRLYRNALDVIWTHLRRSDQ